MRPSVRWRGSATCSERIRVGSSGKPDDDARVTVKEMSRRYGPLILTLAAIWGSSYLFIKVGVRDFEPTVLMALRLLIGGLLLLAFLAVTTGGRAAVTQVRGAWRDGFVFGAINGAIPFTLIAWGETHIDSGVAAIAQGVGADLRRLAGDQVQPEPALERGQAGRHPRRPSRRRRARRRPPGGGRLGGGGNARGRARLVVLRGRRALRAAGPRPRDRARCSRPPRCSTAGCCWCRSRSSSSPTTRPDGSRCSRSSGWRCCGTAVAQLFLFRILRLFGAARLSLVTYLIPAFALLYGSLILDEPLRPSMLVGLGLILGGVALGSGVWRLQRRPVADSAA